jgi:phosphohistidine phosphatase
VKLYFFRHGQAEDVQMPDFDDFARRLTSKGVERTEMAGKALNRLGVRPARLYSSPRLRARQTADILGKAFEITVTVREELNFGFSPQQVEMLLDGLKNGDEVMFVGHEPDLSATVSQLAGGGEVVMKKGGLARVDVSGEMPLQGVLVWVLPPKLLDMLGEG